MGIIKELGSPAARCISAIYFHEAAEQCIFKRPQINAAPLWWDSGRQAYESRQAGMQTERGERQWDIQRDTGKEDDENSSSPCAVGLSERFRWGRPAEGRGFPALLGLPSHPQAPASSQGYNLKTLRACQLGDKAFMANDNAWNARHYCFKRWDTTSLLGVKLSRIPWMVKLDVFAAVYLVTVFCFSRYTILFCCFWLCSE